MSELASALFSIADASEFRFARFYIVCEAVPLGAPGSPLIVCDVTDTFRGLSKRGQDTESDVKRVAEEIQGFCSKEWTVSGCILKRQKTFTSSGHCSLPPPLLAVCLFLCICVAGIFVKVRLHVNTAVRVTCDVFSEVIVVARQDGI